MINNLLSFICVIMVMLPAGGAIQRTMHERISDRVERINSYYDEEFNGKVRIRMSEVCKLLRGLHDAMGIAGEQGVIVLSKGQVANLVERLSTCNEDENIEKFIERAGCPTFRFKRFMNDEARTRGECLRYYIFKKSFNIVDDRVDKNVSLYFDSCGKFEFALASDNLLCFRDGFHAREGCVGSVRKATTDRTPRVGDEMLEKFEHNVQLFGGVRHAQNAITNVLIDVVFEGGDGGLDREFALMMPNFRSCIKSTGNGEIHFADVDCGIHLARKDMPNGMTSVRKIGFGRKFKCWRLDNYHDSSVVYCGGGGLMFSIDDISQDKTNMMQITKADLCQIANCHGKYFLSSGVRWLMRYLKKGKDTTYLHDKLDPNKWLILKYILWVDDKRGEGASQELMFSYDIVRICEGSTSTLRKGILPLIVKDQSTNQTDGVRIMLTKRAEWNYTIDVEFEGVGCPIMVYQHDINEAIQAGNIRP